MPTSFPNPALTAAQIARWRDVLASQIGPYAYLMPVEDIERHRAALQARVNRTAMPTPKELQGEAR